MTSTKLASILSGLWAAHRPGTASAAPGAVRQVLTLVPERLAGGDPAEAPLASAATPAADEWEERAAVLEYEAGLSRDEAERRARAEAPG